MSPLGKICPGRFWYCPLWPPDKNVRLQIPCYPESIWCVLRIKSKSAYPLSQALTCFHRHPSSQGEAQACPQKGAPGGRETSSTEREGAPPPPIPSPHTRDRVSQPEIPAISGRRQTAGSPESSAAHWLLQTKL